MKFYRVEVTAKFPAYNETPGIIEVFAKDSKVAISKARKEMSRSGWTKQDGPMTYRIIKD